MTLQPELAAALAALSPEQRRHISRANAAAFVAVLEEMAEEGHTIATQEAAAAACESEECEPHDPLARPSQDEDDAGHGPHLRPGAAYAPAAS